MEQFPEIETGRLQLNELRPKDIPRIVKYASNKKIWDTTLNIPFPYTEQDAVYWLNLAHQGFKEGDQVIFAIRLKPALEFIGGISLTVDKRFDRAEIGYWLAEPFWGQGFMTEAARSLVTYGFEQLGLNKITSSHFETNPASGKVLVKSGLKKEGELKEHIKKHSAYHTLVVYGLTQKEYEDKAAQ